MDTTEVVGCGGMKEAVQHDKDDENRYQNTLLWEGTTLFVDLDHPRISHPTIFMYIASIVTNSVFAELHVLHLQANYRQSHATLRL